MSSPLEVLESLRRPRLLIRAARHGLADYRRERDLARIIRSARLPTTVSALDALISAEADMEETRQSGNAAYSIARHVDLLIALMGEARLIPKLAAPA